MTTARVAIPYDAIAAFCQKWGVTEFALFGSVLRPDFRPDSDIDVLVSFAPEAKVSLFRLVEMQSELERILGRPVDLVDRQSVEQSANYIRRHHILTNMEPIYAAG